MQHAICDSLTRGPKDEEIHADMSESARHACSTRVNLGGSTHPCDQDQSDRGPNGLKSLTGGHEPNSPTDENRSAEIVQLTGLEIEIRKPVDWAC